MSTAAVLDYTHSELPQPHPQRARDILARHPEVRTLFGRNPWTAVFVFVLVGIQLAVAYFASQIGWIWVALLAYALGAFVNHALFVLNHESRAQPDPARHRARTTSSASWATSRSRSRARSRSAATTCCTTRTKVSTSSTPTSRVGARRASSGTPRGARPCGSRCLGVMQALRPLRVKARQRARPVGAAELRRDRRRRRGARGRCGAEGARLPDAVDVLRARSAPRRWSLDPGAHRDRARARRRTRTTGR